MRPIASRRRQAHSERDDDNGSTSCALTRQLYIQANYVPSYKGMPELTNRDPVVNSGFEIIRGNMETIRY